MASISKKAALCFLLTLALSSLLIAFSIHHKMEHERSGMERLIIAKSAKIKEVVTRLVYKTQVLATLVIQNNGEIKNFEQVASTLIDDPSIINIVLAPDGVVSKVYPLQGNEDVLGYNLLGPGAGNKEAALAKEMGEMVFAGPFPLMESGGLALVGRMPVWVVKDNRRSFWGLITITLDYPEALDGVGLYTLEAAGHAYEIWRINPDDNSRQTIAGSRQAGHNHTPYIEKTIHIFNAVWNFRVFQKNAWYEYSQSWLMIMCGFSISLLVGFIMQNNFALRNMKQRLENQLRLDSLTGLLNRQGFYGEVKRQGQQPFRLYFIDLNYFKKINDTCGHNAGDRVLVKFSRILREYLNHKYIIARYSGDEFIVLRMGAPLGQTEEKMLWHRIGREYSQTFKNHELGRIALSFSMGTADFPEEGDNIEQLITKADKRMYAQKEKLYSLDQKRRATDRLPESA